jgi:hypothetical protein
MFVNVCTPPHWKHYAVKITAVTFLKEYAIR